MYVYRPCIRVLAQGGIALYLDMLIEHVSEAASKTCDLLSDANTNNHGEPFFALMP
jgi:hypothetical protein